MNISRRDFVHGGCTVAAATLVPSFFDLAEARLRGITAIQTGGFNGGKSQINFNFLFAGGEYPFNNQLLCSIGWGSLGTGLARVITPDMLDPNGYPTTLVNTYGVNTTGAYLNYFVPPQSGVGSRAGWYVIAVTGNGTFSTGFTANVQTPATATFTASISAGVLNVTTTPSNTIYKGMPISVGGYVGVQLSGTTGGVGTYQAIGSPNTTSQGLSVSAGSLTSTTGSGRYVFNSSTAHEYFLAITAIGSPYISNAYVCHVDDEAAYLSGQVWGAQFLARLRQGKPGVLRFLNWMGQNASNEANVSTWWTANRPLSYAYYGDTELRPSIFSGITTQGSNGAYTVAAPAVSSSNNGAAWDGVLRDKTTVSVLFDRSGYTGITGATSSGSQTILNVNTGGQDAQGFTVGESVQISGVTVSTGGTWTGLNTTTTIAAIGTGTVTVNVNSSGFTGTPSFTSADLYHGSITLDVAGTGNIQVFGSQSAALFTTQYPSAGASGLATLVYDATLNAWLKRGGDAALGNYGLDNGVPLSLMINLCSVVGAHPHIPAYYLTCTPITDWLPNVISYIKNNGPSWMVPRIEGPNEQWNPEFLANSYAFAISAVYGWGSSQYHDWYGKVMSTFGQLLSQLYGGNTSKYCLLCGLQTINGSLGAAQSSNARLASTQYIGQTPQSPLTGSWGTITFSSTVGVAEAYRWVTHICVANYFDPAIYGTTLGTPNEATLAAAFAGGDNTAPTTYANSVYVPNSPVTFTVETPGIVTWPNHPFEGNNDEYVQFATTSMSMPGGTNSNHVYFVGTVIDANNFQLLTTAGAPVAITSTGSNVAGFAAFSSANLPQLLYILNIWKIWAQSFTVPVNKMTFYEGGDSPDYGNGGTSNVDLLRAASKLVTTMPNDALGMQGGLTTNYNNCVSLSGGGFTAEFPSLFQLGGLAPSNNAWSVLENIYVSPDPPQWDAIVAFNA